MPQGQIEAEDCPEVLAGEREMTAKQDRVALDTMSCILHAAEMGVSWEDYCEKVLDYGRKRIRMISKGLK